jgi:tetratricopeptide (TPR) repeat protein
LNVLPFRRILLIAACFGLFRSEAAVVAQATNLPQFPISPQARVSPGMGDPMFAVLQRMVVENPHRADTWRLLGRLHWRQNQIPAAIDCFGRALALQPDNAAAHADLGELLAQLGDHAAASWHFDQVMQIAPSSSYAASLVERGIRPPPALAPAEAESPMPRNDSPQNIFAASYEIQTFDGADDLERRLNQLESDVVSPPPKSLRAFVEFGALYNTNIALTPISRELAGDAADSFQSFLSPDLEWNALGQGAWRSGPLFRGYFTANEEHVRSLNLASFQPGGFVEHDAFWRDGQLIGRLEYVYSLDLLDGDSFGDRHAVTASLTAILPELDVIYAYVRTSLSDFADDGANPAVDSLDGPALTAGVSRFYQTGWFLLPTWSLGADVESADTQGADFRYRAINLHTDATVRLTSRLEFIARAGVGYRDYPDFTGPVSRDELTWRASGRLRWRWTDWLSSSLVVNHDRFASDNEDFDTQRTEAGVATTLLH